VSEIHTAPKRLVDLNPKWGRTGEERTHLIFDCPCGGGPAWPDCGGKVIIPITGEHRWQCTAGDDFATLTLSPSVHLPGHWHGWVQNGVVTSC